MSDPEVERIVNLILNTVQLLALAWIAARYRTNGNGSGK